MKETTLIPERICICRRCHGTGTVTVYELKDVRRLYPQTKVCPLCKGSGRVVISGEVHKNVEPYEPTDEPV